MKNSLQDDSEKNPDLNEESDRRGKMLRRKSQPSLSADRMKLHIK